MKRILLDYDNTICDFNRMLVEKWKDLPGKYQKFKFNYEDITEYSLINCLCNVGYKKKEAISLLTDFWNVEDLYQKYYIDAKYRDSILRLLKGMKERQDVFIELYTMCNTFIMTESKLKRIKEDKELCDILDSIIINTCKNYYKFEKPINYDVMIDDNPNLISNYLENNKNGMVFMPKWRYNEYLLPNVNIIGVL